MARKKKIEIPTTDKTETIEFADNDLKALFDNTFIENFGKKQAPPGYITPTGIRPLDAILGGGFVSSAPICIVSTPETGKSTTAFQFAKIFTERYGDDAFAIYLDIEGAGGEIEGIHEQSRPNIMKIDPRRFSHKKALLSLDDIDKFFAQIVQKKKEIEEKRGKELKMLIIWDSLAATQPEKVETSDRPEEYTGYHARMLGHILNKIKTPLSFARITLFCIDQSRANIKMGGV